MNSIWNKKLYAPALKIVKNAHKDWTPARLASYADSVAVGNWPSYLSDKYMGGLKNIIAQTRIMSSYGFFQMIYFIAITERGYPENNTNLPEVLMITDTSFTYSTRHLIAMFSNKGINENYYSNTGWKAGFETTWYKVFGLYNGSYNSKTQKSKYADDVFKYMKNNLPQSK